jgi:hypothetical protein
MASRLVRRNPVPADGSASTSPPNLCADARNLNTLVIGTEAGLLVNKTRKSDDSGLES